jgi:hypothetical protein
VKNRGLNLLVFVITLIVLPLATISLASAAKLTLTWVDTSNSEQGFRIERRLGSTGSYQQYAAVAANTQTYSDVNVSSGTTYCYRVAAFNSAGSSGYSNENCATTAVEKLSLNIAKSGTGSGTIRSSTGGINCGSDCLESLPAGTTVTLSAVAAAGSKFTGWSGDADCSDGSVTMNGAKTCTASFALDSVSVTLTVSKGGTGSGTVTSSLAGIGCGSDCSENYPSGTVITLTAKAASGSTFAGWSGQADCADGTITLNASATCTATFTANKGSAYTLTTTVVNQITASGAASGRIVSKPAGIDCGDDCSHEYKPGTVVYLTPVPAANSKFAGWSGNSDCGNGSVKMIASKTCTATFSPKTTTAVSQKELAAKNGKEKLARTVSSNMAASADLSASLNAKIGIYRPATGEWLLDRNGSHAWEGCKSDLCVRLFNPNDALPVVGDWNNSGTTKLGLFSADSLEWFLDANGNGVWDGCQVDICSETTGAATDQPLVGQWSKGGADSIAIFRPTENKWHLDLNGNQVLESCKIDKCSNFSIYQSGDVAVAGDWTGRGITQIGFFRPSTGQWFLDGNGNGVWDRCKQDLCVNSFGMAGDIPVAGDWNGTAITKIGVFRPATGEWFLDLNGNGVWDGPSLDLYVVGFGQAGDLPVVGRW